MIEFVAIVLLTSGPDTNNAAFQVSQSAPPNALFVTVKQANDTSAPYDRWFRSVADLTNPISLDYVFRELKNQGIKLQKTLPSGVNDLFTVFDTSKCLELNHALQANGMPELYKYNDVVNANVVLVRSGMKDVVFS